MVLSYIGAILTIIMSILIIVALTGIVVTVTMLTELIKDWKNK